MPTEPARAVPHANNFDFLRLAAALAVMVSHQFALSGRPEPVVLHGSVGGWGVLVFFAISGYLVGTSWQRDPHAGRFAARRLLRIWPGLAVAVVLMAFAVGPLITTLTVRDYFHTDATWRYLRNLSLISFQPFLPGVFAGNPAPNSANGSLWTIPIEVACYAALAALGALGIAANRWRLSLVTLAAGYVFFFAWKVGYDNPLRMPVQMGMVFMFSACLAVWRHHWLPLAWPFAAGWAALVAGLWVSGLQEMAVMLAVAGGTAFAGTRSTPVLRRSGRFGDLSYGVYIYAFPVQQLFIAGSGNQWSVGGGLAVVVATTVVLAWLSWHGIEKRALRLKGRLPGAQAAASAAVPDAGKAAG